MYNKSVSTAKSIRLSHFSFIACSLWLLCLLCYTVAQQRSFEVVHEQSVIETRQSKATTPEDNSFFPKRKRRAASGRIQTHDVLRTRQTLYQLSHQGSSAGHAESLNVMQGKMCLLPDKQGYSILLL